MAEAHRLSIIIPNWNGEAFLPKALASLEPGARKEGAELLVVDDASDDGSVALIHRRFPWVRLLQNPTNLGFSQTVNRGLHEARSPLVVLLNNDIVVRPDFLERVTAPFLVAGNASLFAVSAHTLQWTTGAPNHLCMNGHWRKGWIERVWSDPVETVPALFVQGGACALRRERALALGGFRELYRPGYWEDYDLSYRAARAGWPSLYQPDAVVYHLGKASFEARYGRDGVDALRLRNELLFHWANLDDPAMIAAHGRALIRRILGGLVRGDALMCKAFLKALPRLGAVIRERRNRSPLTGATRDRDLIG